MPETVTGEGRALAEAEIESIIRRHVYCDATGLSPHVASVLLRGFDRAAKEIITALRERGSVSLREDGPDLGIPDESPDDAMDLVDQIEAAFQADGALSYAPDGTPCLTWAGRQAIGRIVDREGCGAEAMREAAKIACLDLADAYRETSESHMRGQNTTKAREAMDWAIGAMECAHAVAKLLVLGGEHA